MNKKEPSRPKARVPRGFADARAEEIRAREAMLSSIKEVYELYGFEPLETSALEYTDALGKFLPDVDRPEGGVFSLQDDDEQWLSLRYDLTAPLARFVAENFDALPKPFRRYQFGPVWRNEKPGPGRYRQFYQFDADTVGSASPAADAELLMMLADTLEALGLKRGQYIVKLNSRHLLDGVLDAAQVDPLKRIGVLRAIDKLDRLKEKGVAELLGQGRTDESGDVTKGAQLESHQVERIMSFLHFTKVARDWESVKVWLEETLYGPFGEAGRASAQSILDIAEVLTASGYEADRIHFDPTVVRGLEYYTGAVFEAQVTFPVKNEQGETVIFGSVAGGGRYDDLVARFTGQQVPATGVSIGVSRLQAALRALRGQVSLARGPVVVLALDPKSAASAQKMVSELRNAGIRAELYLGSSGMRAQLKYADRRNSPIAVIEGDDERAKGEVTLKDLLQGAEMAKTIESNEAWRKAQPAQISVPRGKLVEEVRAMLERQKARG
ncbi:MAG: histidine--tRNA ligase [Alphaproteobacteria bacterium]